MLEIKKDSITSDIQNGFMSPQAYLEKLRDYQKSEKANFMAARDDGLDKENLELIMKRLEQINAEAREIEAGLQSQPDEGAIVPLEAPAESQVPASSVPPG